MVKQWTNKSEKLFSEIKKYGPIKSKSSRKEWDRRKYFTKHYAWAVPNKTAIRKIKKFAEKGQILEPGAGLGLWAFLLQDAGANVIANRRLFMEKENSKQEKLYKSRKT